MGAVVNIHFLPWISVLALAGCASSADPSRAGAEPVCEQPAPALGSVVVRREQCVVTTEEQRQESRRRAREMMEEQNRSRDGARSKAMGS